jgi:hypothetical protein
VKAALDPRLRGDDAESKKPPEGGFGGIAQQCALLRSMRWPYFVPEAALEAAAAAPEAAAAASEAAPAAAEAAPAEASAEGAGAGAGAGAAAGAGAGAGAGSSFLPQAARAAAAISVARTSDFFISGFLLRGGTTIPECVQAVSSR